MTKRESRTHAHARNRNRVVCESSKNSRYRNPSIFVGCRVGCKKSRMMQATRLPLQTSDPMSTEVSSSDSADGSGMDEFGYLAVILSIILGLR